MGSWKDILFVELVELESDWLSEQPVGVHRVSANESDAVSDSRPMSIDAFCGYEGGRKALVDVN